jgi:ribonucleotide reductase alpha subunit
MIEDGHRKKIVQVTAPTGCAAFNLGGSTIHSAMPGFEPRGKRKTGGSVQMKAVLPYLSSRSTAVYKEMWEHVKYLIIDEVSMVGTVSLAQIDHWLRVVCGEIDRRRTVLPFGGVHVILLGT